MPNLAIIIVNYNTRDLLLTCLRSVYANHTENRYHVIVVDNGSTDGSVDAVQRDFPGLTLIKSDRNGGFGYANNLALRWLSSLTALPQTGTGRDSIVMNGPPAGAQPTGEVPGQGHAGLPLQCDYVLFLNPDTVLPPNALEVTVAFMQRQPEAGVMGPKVVKLDGTLDLACRRSFPTPASSFFKLTGLSKLFPRNRLVARYNLTYLSDHETAEVDSVMGAYMLVRARALHDAGLFDERFFMYGEDLDLAFRIKARGWKVFYHPAVEVLHHKGASSRKQSERSIREFYRAMQIFYHKHYAPHTNFLLNIVVEVGIRLRGAIALLQNALRPSEKKRVT
jgi:GT2 family glycosyltransferase